MDSERKKTMLRFQNKLCPACRSRFNEKADIVVCPICGTPHHRTCYLTNNKCSLEELHESGWTWNGMLPDEEPEKPTHEELSAVISAAIDPPEVDSHHAEYPSGTPYEEEQRMFEDKLGDDNPFKELFDSLGDKEIGADGVSMHELVAYSATSAYHYGRAFKTFRGNVDGRKRKMFLNFCSGLFAPVFQFYRKMNVFGVFTLLLLMAPSLISVMLQDRISESSADPILYWLNFVQIIIMVLLCVFGDYIYYRHCVKSIVRFRKSYDGDTKSDDYFMALYELGKPTLAGGLIGALAMSFGQACLLALSRMI